MLYVLCHDDKTVNKHDLYKVGAFGHLRKFSIDFSMTKDLLMLFAGKHTSGHAKQQTKMFSKLPCGPGGGGTTVYAGTGCPNPWDAFFSSRK